MNKVSGILMPVFIVALTVYHLVEKEEGDKKKELVTRKELVEFLKEVLDEQAINKALNEALDYSFVKMTYDEKTKEKGYIPPLITGNIEGLYSLWEEEYLPKLKVDEIPE